MAQCYVCRPERKLDHYLDLRSVPGLDAEALFVNQNLRGLQECVAVPRVHCGEFRLMAAEDSRRFWRALGRVLAEFLAEGAMGLQLEVSYGGWIVHKPGSPHYHAHVHVLCTNFDATVGRLQDRRIAQRPPNRTPKPTPQDDVEEDVSDAILGRHPGWAEASFLEAVASGADAVPVFQQVAEWFPALDGVLTVTHLDHRPSRFSIRTAAADAAALKAALAALKVPAKRKREEDKDDAEGRPSHKVVATPTGVAVPEPLPFPALPPGWGHGRSRTYGNYFFFALADEQTKSWVHPVTKLEYRANPLPAPSYTSPSDAHRT
eukprot:GGOE01061297.1.p2 GENE.GGOE01061297.1~~GGOE01061297.1.p2  ORF type:complete len:329 (-),score=87.23 GGOE01061297.1:29-985(-)